MLVPQEAELALVSRVNHLYIGAHTLENPVCSRLRLPVIDIRQHLQQNGLLLARAEVEVLHLFLGVATRGEESEFVGVLLDVGVRLTSVALGSWYGVDWCGWWF